MSKKVQDNFEPPKRIAGLQKSKMIIRAESLKEKQFALICSQIRLNELKKARSEKQKNDRVAKRTKSL